MMTPRNPPRLTGPSPVPMQSAPRAPHFQHLVTALLRFLRWSTCFATQAIRRPLFRLCRQPCCHGPLR